MQKRIGGLEQRRCPRIVHGGQHLVTSEVDAKRRLQPSPWLLRQSLQNHFDLGLGVGWLRVGQRNAHQTGARLNGGMQTPYSFVKSHCLCIGGHGLWVFLQTFTDKSQDGQRISLTGVAIQLLCLLPALFGRGQRLRRIAGGMGMQGKRQQAPKPLSGWCLRILKHAGIVIEARLRRRVIAQYGVQASELEQGHHFPQGIADLLIEVQRLSGQGLGPVILAEQTHHLPQF